LALIVQALRGVFGTRVAPVTGSVHCFRYTCVQVDGLYVGTRAICSAAGTPYYVSPV
jgi:hypothetical protein